MIDPTVRPAVASDASQLRSIEAEARAALVDQRGGVRWLATHPERGAAWSDRILAGGVFVAHIDDVVVGYVVVSLDGTLATVDDVFVLVAARELGFGDELLAAALEYARSRRATLLEGTALPGDRDTKNLYERAGIKARLIIVSTPI